MTILAPFAAVESMVLRDSLALLANAVVSIAGAPEVGGEFDEPGTVGSVGALGMAATRPSVVVAASAVPAKPVGQPIRVNGVAYVIAEDEPVGGGATRLLLELDLGGAR